MERTPGKYEKAVTACRIANEEVRGREYTTNITDQRDVCFEG
jgi:hypothetical protein